MITAHRHHTTANHGKVDALVALFPAFREALGGLQSLTRREVLTGQQPQGWRVMSADTLMFSHRLSARQMKSAQNMTHAAVTSWQESLVGDVRTAITGSALPDLRKTVLYRINARKAWWAAELTLPWVLAPRTGELVVCSEKQAASDPAAVWLEVDPADLALVRRIAKHSQKRCRYPDLRRVDTLLLDSIVAKPTPAATASCSGTVGWWVKIATLVSGKPVSVPLAANPYFERVREAGEAAGGRMCGAIQLHLNRDHHGQPDTVAVSLLCNTPDAPARTEGHWLGVDFGFGSALLATSDGHLLGQAMLARLRELDAALTPLTADLQRRGVRLKTDVRYRRLHRRITDYATNEIGRLFNQIAAHHGQDAAKGVVAEKLDFRGGGLSRRLNRIATRTGRGVLKARLSALTAKHGIAVVEVPSPWTSCECSGCSYTTKRNRTSRRFRCGFCGLKLHADVNAARVVQSRRSRRTSDHTGPRARKNTLLLLDSRHRKRWNLPARGAVSDIAGALRRTA